ncbi:PQQ-dependent sugar dehydrogenase [Virgibacillus flavescens]|uniref:PQQ-dependent sugar dehydrogenase n=1 Tax=Virgibacillus flavescens TaxID=1611422 RepID=UPI003D33E416
MRVLFALSFVFVLLVGCSEPTEETVEPEEETRAKMKVIAENLKVPWEIQRVDGTFYISERTGSIVIVKDGVQARKAVNFEKNISNQSEAGLLGIAIPSNFAEKNVAYAYYSYQENGSYFQRVIKMKETDASWVETEILLDEIPGGEFHQGGRIAIGPDQKLYITTGDATNEKSAQDLNSLAGKIVRMNMDGSIPTDNPFDNSYVFTYGHRNPQGLSWDENNSLYATEHGSSAFDEINKIEKGQNYGWPVIRGDESKKGMTEPIVHSGKSTWAPSGMAYFKGHFYFASLRGEGVRRFNPDTEQVELIMDGIGRVRDVFAAENGIYFITNNTDGRGNAAENDDKLIFVPKGE